MVGGGDSNMSDMKTSQIEGEYEVEEHSWISMQFAPKGKKEKTEGSRDSEELKTVCPSSVQPIGHRGESNHLILLSSCHHHHHLHCLSLPPRCTAGEVFVPFPWPLSFPRNKIIIIADGPHIHFGETSKIHHYHPFPGEFVPWPLVEEHPTIT